MTKTTIFTTLTVTHIMDGDRSKSYTMDEEAKRRIAEVLKEQLDADHVEVKSVQTFAKEEKE